MFKLKYNFIVLIQIIFSILNSILLIKIFGVSAKSDAYLLSCSILAIIHLILILPVFQFIPFYNDLKVKSLKKSHDFYNYLMLFSLLYGVILCLLFLFGINILVKIFTLHIDAERLILLKQLLSISIFGSAFYTINELNAQLLNAEMKFSLPYIISTIPNMCIVASQLYLIHIHSQNIILLAYAQAIALLLGAILGTLYITKTLIRFKPVFIYEGISKFIKNSVGMQLGNSIYHICFPIILNNFLVTMPKGFVSYFYYARKIIDIINSFTIGPSAKILRSRIAEYFAKKLLPEINKSIKSFNLWGAIIFIVAIIIAYYAQTPILKLINNHLTYTDLNMIKQIFLSLTAWYYFMLIESPYVVINMTSKKEWILIIVNSSFVIIFILGMLALHHKIGIYSVGISALVAQYFNYIWHKKFALKTLKSLSDN